MKSEKLIEILTEVRKDRNELVDRINEHIDADGKNVETIERIFKRLIASINNANQNFDVVEKDLKDINKRLNNLEKKK